MKEPIIPSLKFKTYKFTPRERPNKHGICILPMFSEFGCETLAALYCLPKLLQDRCLGKYVIVMGWHGREYLYRHLVDEYWELDESFQWLRKYTRAFHHHSKNLKMAEKLASEHGTIISADEVSNIVVFPKLDTCLSCKRKLPCICGAIMPEEGIFNYIAIAKKDVRWLPEPSKESMERAKKYITPNSIGITARARPVYGRNLDSIFYERLIFMLEDLGYHIVWLGEKISILPCPFPRITNFSESEDAKDLETTFALVSQLKFTIQFWTASSRLAALMGTPYILFESPDQLWGQGQEGMRIELCTKGKRKIVATQFKNFAENPTKGLKMVKQAVNEVREENYQDIIGLVENQMLVKMMRAERAIQWKT